MKKILYYIGGLGLLPTECKIFHAKLGKRCFTKACTVLILSLFGLRIERKLRSVNTL